MNLLWFILLGYSYANPNEPNLPVRVTTGIYAAQVNMDFYDSSVPLIYEMDMPDPSTLQAFMTIPPNSNLQGLSTLGAILDETKHLLQFASLPFNNFIQSRRAKRSLDFISDFYAFCCGFATGRSVDQLAAHEKSLDEFTQQVRIQLDTEHKFLKEEAKVYNGFQSRVERALNKSSSTFSSITSELVESEKDIESQVISIMQGMIQVATMLHHSAATNTRLQVLSDCRNKLIPLSVVTPVALLRDLKGLATSLQDVRMSKIVVTVKVPTRITEDQYTLYSLTPLPFASQGSTCQVRSCPNP
jgi:hypothetical protein